MLNEHLAVRFEAAYKKACDSRDPAVGALTTLADSLTGAGAASSDLRACVFGALLQAYAMGRAADADLHKADAEARVQGVKSALERQILAILRA